MNPTLHILANPYGITDLKYRMEPFNIAVHKFITNMQALGWHTVHYGHEKSNVPCENVPVIFANELIAQGEHDLFLHNNDLSEKFAVRANEHLRHRCQPRDIVLCFYGHPHQKAVQDLKDVFVVEPSIGYWPSSVFAPYRVFTSYAGMHYYYGMHGQLLNPSWFDAVIPNAMTPDEFEYSNKKKDYILYLGRIMPDKGIDLAIQTTGYTGHQLIIAGTGNLQELGYQQCPDHVKLFGYANANQRKELLRDAKALIAPTHYIEPFGNMVAEALMSGTPVITSDWGGFVDTNQHGVTGFRCRDFGDFVTAINSLHRIDHQECRIWAMSRFSDSVVHDQFDHYLKKIHRSDFYYAKNIQ